MYTCDLCTLERARRLMHQPPHPFESSKTTPVTAVTEIKICAYFKISAAQCALIRDAVQWLVWHVLLIKHWFNNRKRKQNDSSSVDQQSRPKRKARASLSLKRGPNLRTRHMLTEVSLAAYIFKRTRLSMSMSAYSSTKYHSTLQRLLRIETG